MAYIDPITDRTMADIIQTTFKGRFNIMDWERIINNTSFARELVFSLRGVPIPELITMSTPTRTDKPTAADINDLVQNIITVQTAAHVAQANAYTLKVDYENGADKRGPDYQIVNAWEKVIDLIVKYHEIVKVVRRPICGVGATGAGMTRQWMFRTKRIVLGRVPICGFAVCDSGLLRQNMFRR